MAVVRRLARLDTLDAQGEVGSEAALGVLELRRGRSERPPRRVARGVVLQMERTQ
jgi:hypothetical protein